MTRWLSWFCTCVVVIVFLTMAFNQVRLILVKVLTKRERDHSQLYILSFSKTEYDIASSKSWKHEAWLVWTIEIRYTVLDIGRTSARQKLWSFSMNVARFGGNNSFHKLFNIFAMFHPVFNTTSYICRHPCCCKQAMPLRQPRYSNYVGYLYLNLKVTKYSMMHSTTFRLAEGPALALGGGDIGYRGPAIRARSGTMRIL